MATLNNTSAAMDLLEKPRSDSIEDTNSWPKLWPAIISFMAIILAIAGIVTVSVLRANYGGNYPYDYGVVMDAGSTKTNTLAYKWRSDKDRGTGCVTQEDKCKAEGGIAKMNPMKLDPVIDCAKKVTNVVESSVRYKTPLYFVATAGMRLLNLTNPERAEQILEQLNLHLNETGLSVRAIEIISGRDEGLYGWITTNFLLKTLEIDKDPSNITTYGALDMGGASMQISYALLDDESNSSSSVRKLDLYGQDHYVFSYSNLCFGREEAERRHRFFLATSAKEKGGIISDPCSPEGFNYTLTKTELFDQPCTKVKNPNPDKNDTVYYFEGTSHPEYCKGNVSRLLDENLCKDFGFKECFKHLENIPKNQNYLAFASYFFTTDFLNATKSSLEEFTSKVKEYCQLSMNDIEKFNNTYGPQYCFNGMYVQDVLVNGFKFSDSTWKNLRFEGTIADKDVGWTLGYMINATNIIPPKERNPKLVSSAVLGISLAVFITAIIISIFCMLKHARKGYSSVDKP